MATPATAATMKIVSVMRTVASGPTPASAIHLPTLFDRRL